MSAVGDFEFKEVLDSYVPSTGNDVSRDKFQAHVCSQFAHTGSSAKVKEGKKECFLWSANIAEAAKQAQCAGAFALHLGLVYMEQLDQTICEAHEEDVKAQKGNTAVAIKKNTVDSGVMRVVRQWNESVERAVATHELLRMSYQATSVGDEWVIGTIPADIAADRTQQIDIEIPDGCPWALADITKVAAGDFKVGDYKVPFEDTNKVTGSVFEFKNESGGQIPSGALLKIVTTDNGVLPASKAAPKAKLSGRVPGYASYDKSDNSLPIDLCARHPPSTAHSAFPPGMWLFPEGFLDALRRKRLNTSSSTEVTLFPRTFIDPAIHFTCYQHADEKDDDLEKNIKALFSGRLALRLSQMLKAASETATYGTVGDDMYEVAMWMLTNLSVQDYEEVRNAVKKTSGVECPATEWNMTVPRPARDGKTYIRRKLPGGTAAQSTLDPINLLFKRFLSKKEIVDMYEGGSNKQLPRSKRTLRETFDHTKYVAAADNKTKSIMGRRYEAIHEALLGEGFQGMWAPVASLLYPKYTSELCGSLSRMAQQRTIARAMLRKPDGKKTVLEQKCIAWITGQVMSVTCPGESCTVEVDCDTKLTDQQEAALELNRDKQFAFLDSLRVMAESLPAPTQEQMQTRMKFVLGVARDVDMAAEYKTIYDAFANDNAAGRTNFVKAIKAQKNELFKEKEDMVKELATRSAFVSIRGFQKRVNPPKHEDPALLYFEPLDSVIVLSYVGCAVNLGGKRFVIPLPCRIGAQTSDYYFYDQYGSNDPSEIQECFGAKGVAAWAVIKKMARDKAVRVANIPHPRFDIAGELQNLVPAVPAA